MPLLHVGMRGQGGVHSSPQSRQLGLSDWTRPVGSVTMLTRGCPWSWSLLGEWRQENLQLVKRQAKVVDKSKMLICRSCIMVSTCLLHVWDVCFSQILGKSVLGLWENWRTHTHTNTHQFWGRLMMKHLQALNDSNSLFYNALTL